MIAWLTHHWNPRMIECHFPSRKPRLSISALDRVLLHHVFLHHALQHHTVHKINPKHTLTLIQPKMYYSCYAAAGVKRMWRPSQPVGQTCSEMHPFDNPPRYRRPTTLMSVILLYSHFSWLLAGTQPNGGKTPDERTLGLENSVVQKCTVLKRG